MPYSADITTTDSYQYLPCPRSTRVTVQVSNNAIAIGFGKVARESLFRPGTGIYPPTDETYLPLAGGLYRECDEIRVKSATTGHAADVKITALQ